MIVILVPASLLVRTSSASDHADPTHLRGPETNITDLFFFPNGDRMILIFNVRRALSSPPPYELQPYAYEIHFDFSTPVDFTDAGDRARYGGTIAQPAALHADATVSIRLNDNAGLAQIEYRGLNDTDQIATFFGVRDDPFNFPRFFGVNAISMALDLPRSAFPVGQQDFILWGTTERDGQKVDHVGRSIRTQLPRFGFLNTVEPKDQVGALMEQADKTSRLYNFLKGNREWWSAAIAELMETTFLIRKYDAQPDVMIYSDRFPSGYPNGRRIDDDVVAQTCSFGDCLLQDIAFIEGGFPRATHNDKPFLPQFPFLAEPWPDKQPPAPPSRSLTPYLVVGAIVLILLAWAVVEAARGLLCLLLRRLAAKRMGPAT
ncbi:hypothetical protein ACQKKX_05740 [Neorhizobium sp. NPDC001467]|uniref:hypothetical protein n=1 Tax=Neorhizobium sp. NPDC001467 TaxID=3390595 RepID=UPI003D03565F